MQQAEMAVKSSRNRMLVIATVLGVIAATGFIANMLRGAPDDLDLSRSKATESKLYAAAIAPEKEPVRQGELHNWVLTLTTPDGQAVEDARIAVDGGMPQHHHGLPTSPQATSYLGEGRYRIEGVKFNMGGWWELEFSISGPPGDDRVVFNLTL